MCKVRYARRYAMFLESDKYDIWITRIDDAINAKGVPYLKCKGYHKFKFISSKGNRANGIDFFSLQLFGDEELFTETKNRLWGCELDKPKLKLHLIKCEVEMPLRKIGTMSVIMPVLKVYEYDFTSRKYGTKQKNKKKLKYDLLAEEVASTEEFIIE